MNVSSLLPPNYESLPEAVICEVAQSSRPLSHTHAAYSGVRTNLTRDYSSSRSAYLPKLTQGPTTRKKLISRSRSITREDAILLKRQRRSQAQQRYRAKVREKEGALGYEVQMLREQVEQLKYQHKTTIAQGVPMQAGPWGVVAEYFRLFGRGLTTNTPPILNNSAPKTECPVNYQAKRDFLQATMAPDVSVNTGHGFDRLLWGWETLSRYYPDFDVKLIRLEMGAGNSLLTSTKTTITVTENTLNFVFPHLLNIDDVRGSMLGTKLLGKQLVVKGSGVFIWDDAKDRVISTLYSVDMLTPVLELLGNLDDVSLVFAKALVTPGCKFQLPTRQ
ncbi:hypothetical protein PI125_g20682 [Phytophthora idaei]|nr:hypothetical protein PI125_g20682 [Phytophthora idaei]KAG3133591.1 hypothetical protein PI126_g19105 [Phytophthora idaei]